VFQIHAWFEAPVCLAKFANPAMFQNMGTITMNVSLNEDLKAFVEARVKERGYSSYSEYVRDLVRRDELEAARDRLRALITEGLNSAPGRSFDEVVEEMRHRIRSHRKA
jgi:antitoxin ParD1/3/4